MYECTRMCVCVCVCVLYYVYAITQLQTNELKRTNLTLHNKSVLNLCPISLLLTLEFTAVENSMLT